jgi:hypothetical protein
VEEKIIKSLIELYREQGLDVTAMTNDPVFTSLPIAKRIELVRDYAKELSQDNGTAITKGDIKVFLKDTAIGAGIGAVGGIIGGVRAGSVIEGVDPKSMLRAIKASTMLGATLGVTSAGIRTLSNIHGRRKLHAQAQKLRDDPSDENAIKLLALRNMQPYTLSKTDILSNIYNKYDSRYAELPLKAPHNAGRMVFEQNEGKPLRPTSHAQSVRDEFLNNDDY